MEMLMILQEQIAKAPDLAYYLTGGGAGAGILGFGAYAVRDFYRRLKKLEEHSKECREKLAAVEGTVKSINENVKLLLKAHLE